MQALQILVLSVTLTAVITGSLFDQSANAELERYKHRVKLIHELLLRENCTDPDSVKVKRNQLFTGDDLSRQQLEVEKMFYRELTEKLVLCRKSKLPQSVGTTLQEVKPTATTIPSTPAGPCSSPQTVNLTESWRKDTGSGLKPDNGQEACDKELQNGVTWFRFSGDGGAQLSDTCRPIASCGAVGGFWSNASMPVSVGEIRKVPVYGSLSGNCNALSWPDTNPMTVQRCSDRPGDFVYKVKGYETCFYTFCGMDL